MNRDVFAKLNEEQQLWYAKAMVSVVMADGRIDAAEEKYLQMLFDVFRHNRHLEELKQFTATVSGPIELDKISEMPIKFSKTLLQDCMSIAIADAEFHDNERHMIFHIGHQLNLSEGEIQEVVNWGCDQLAHIFTFSQ